PAGDLVDKGIVLSGRETFEMVAEDHRPQERLERLARLESRRLLMQPRPDVDEPGTPQTLRGLLGCREELVAEPAIADGREHGHDGRDVARAAALRDEPAA